MKALEVLTLEALAGNCKKPKMFDIRGSPNTLPGQNIASEWCYSGQIYQALKFNGECFFFFSFFFFLFPGCTRRRQLKKLDATLDELVQKGSLLKDTSPEPLFKPITPALGVSTPPTPTTTTTTTTTTTSPLLTSPQSKGLTSH